MAQQTALSVMACPGMVYSFSAKPSFDSAITVSGNVVAPLQLNKLALTSAIIVNGNAEATLFRTRNFTASIVASGNVTTANLTVGGVQDLVAAITANGDMAAPLQLNKLALTADVVTSGNVSANINKTVSFDSVILASGDITTANLTGGVIQSLTADITADGNIAANIQLNKLALTADVVTSGNVSANLSRTRTLTSILTGSGFLAGELSVKVPLSVSLDGTGILAANLLRIRGLEADIFCTGSVGGVLNLTRTITADVTVEITVGANLAVQTAISPWFLRQGAVNKVLD